MIILQFDENITATVSETVKRKANGPPYKGVFSSEEEQTS